MRAGTAVRFREKSHKTSRGRVEAQTEDANITQLGSRRKDDLGPDDWRKSQCGAAHFGSTQMWKKGTLEGVDYKILASGSELL